MTFSPAQLSALRFLAGGGEQIKVRQARVLLEAGAITVKQDLDFRASDGGWVEANITSEGAALVNA